ncbi:MAG: CsgG/HfaB family protein [Candidatus Binatia bacterium]
MTRITFALAACAPLGACTNSPEDPRPVVAISRFHLPMTVVLPGWSGVQTDLLHNQLLSAVVRSGRVIVVERTRLDTILKEQSLTRTEITDAGAAAELGKMLGARYFVIGTISDLKSEERVQSLPYTTRSEHIARGRIKVDARVIDVETGAIVAGETEDCQDEIRSLAHDGEGIARLREQLTEQCAARLARRITDVLAPDAVVSADERGLDAMPTLEPVAAPADPLAGRW